MIYIIGKIPKELNEQNLKKKVVVSVPKCVSAGIISQVFPLHDTDSLTRLQKSWVRAIFKRQPLGK
jgi:N-acetyl-gamma-glutamylphosphate reductase